MHETDVSSTPNLIKISVDVTMETTQNPSYN